MSLSTNFISDMKAVFYLLSRILLQNTNYFDFCCHGNNQRRSILNSRRHNFVPIIFRTRTIVKQVSNFPNLVAMVTEVILGQF